MFNRNANLLIPTILCALLTSCATQGNQTLADLNKQQIQQIITSKVKTKEQSLDALGEPDDIDFYDNGNEKWTYKHTRSSSKPQNFVPIVNIFTKGTNDVHKRVVLVFGRDGNLVNSAITQSTGETNVGAFD